jgi:protein-tyrosine phosphatase
VTAIDLPRRIELDAVHNFRDLGGYVTADGRVTRWRVLFRADGVYRLTPADIDVLRPLGIKSVLDLRTHGELEERGTWPVEHHPVAFHHLPVIDVLWGPDDEPGPDVDVADFLRGKYLEMMEYGEQRLAQALRVLASPDALPAVFHCAAGKDRTGILAAIVLALCGVSDDVIAADYALSTEAMERMVAWFKVTYPDEAAGAKDAPAAFLAAHPASIRGLLDEVRVRHGSVEAYVEAIGVPADVVPNLRALLLEG